VLFYLLRGEEWVILLGRRARDRAGEQGGIAGILLTVDEAAGMLAGLFLIGREAFGGEELRLAAGLGGAHEDALQVIVVGESGLGRATDGLEGVQDRALVGLVAAAVVLEYAALPEPGDVA